MKMTLYPFLVISFLWISMVIPTSAQEFADQSAFSSGTLYQIAIAEDGIYKLDYDFLKNQAGISNLDNLSSDQIQILSNGGGVVPQPNAFDQIDDIQLVKTFRKGLDDGRFNQNDYILLYGEGASKWQRDANGSYSFQRNPYDDFNYYFIKIGEQVEQDIEERPSIGEVGIIFNHYDHLQVINEDRINILGKYQNPGGGKIWYGDEFSNQRLISYTDDFDLSNLGDQDTTFFRVKMAARSSSTSNFTFTIGNQSYAQSIPSVDVVRFDVDFARARTLESYVLHGDLSGQSVSIQYPAVGSGENTGWLDYIELNTRKKLIYNGEPLLFSHQNARYFQSVEFRIQNANNDLVLWEISDPMNPIAQTFNVTNDLLTFGVESLNRNPVFILFDPSRDYPKPTFIQQTENQNLHAIQEADMVIVHHPDFKSAADKLVRHRQAFSGLNTLSVDVNQIFNEFGGGSKDPTAIRDFARMLYQRSSNFQFLLLLGDATYDYRNRNTAISYDNYVTAYETNESLHPVFTYPTDDYFALLSDDEGQNVATQGLLDISVGRIPVKTETEANQVVDKIIRYETDPDGLGDWRNRIMFMADDEDNNLHVRQIDGIATTTNENHRVFNQQKVYLDAYQQISTPGGERYPDAKIAVQNNIFKGTLVYNYLGHGGQEGLADERVLRGQEIDDWNNPKKLPLFITATCSFTGYDEPIYKTAGEHAILNPIGGAVALMTTTRDVYSGQNELLTKTVFNNLFKKVDGEYLTIGEIMRNSKNAISTSSTRIQNARKFSIIGDPAMKLTLPKYDIVTTEMNGIPVGEEIVDTIRALDEVSIKGYVSNDDEVMSAFQGIVSVTVFDKVQIARTLGNDPKSSERDFTVQNRTIFKGSASVVNGEFEFTFVVPKDIKFDYGHGKISYYASDLVSEDANGYFENFIIGGASTTNVADNEGPLIEIFMDNMSFRSGGTTDKDPVLIVKLSDESGINVSGTSIGHDLEAVIDADTKNSFILNDFYEAEVDDYTSGVATFPFFDLADGLHTIDITAWDIANNFSEARSEFIVSSDQKLLIEKLFNFPNPFSDETNFQFDYSRNLNQADVTIQIFSTNGKLVKTIEEPNVIADGRTVRGIQWHGENEYGVVLPRGIYLYRVILDYPEDGSIYTTESKFEKLVLLK